MAEKLIVAAIEVILALVLVPIIYTFSVSANVSATLATVLALVPLVFVFAVVYNAYKQLTG